MQNDIEKLCYNDLACYCSLIDSKYQVAKPHAKIISALEGIESGKIDRLIIQAPPRHGKSYTVSNLFPSWYLGRNPDKSVILSTYGQDLSSDFGRNIKNIINSNESYSYVFPDIELATDSKSVKRFNTNKGGGLFAVGRGGAITGRGGHLILIDDLLKNEKEAQSPTVRKAMIEWYKQTLYTRLMKKGAIVVVSTRWHEEDLIGWLLNDPEQKKENWHTLDLPAIDEDNLPLWPEMFSLESLYRKKRTLGTKNFASLYLNKPAPDEGAILKRGWLKYYDELPIKYDAKYISWDMAFKESNTSDFVVGGVYIKKGSNVYLVEKIKKRMDFPKTLDAVYSLYMKHQDAIAVLIEAKANGQAIIDTIKNQVPGVVPITPTDSKEARLASVAPRYEAGNVLYPNPDTNPWVQDHIEEMLIFPHGKHDDSVDVESQVLNYLRDTLVAEWLDDDLDLEENEPMDW